MGMVSFHSIIGIPGQVARLPAGEQYLGAMVQLKRLRQEVRDGQRHGTARSILGEASGRRSETAEENVANVLPG